MSGTGVGVGCFLLVVQALLEHQRVIRGEGDVGISEVSKIGNRTNTKYSESEL